MMIKGFIKWAKANKKYLPGNLSLNNISKYGVVLSVVRGGVGMWHGFATGRGDSYSRHTEKELKKDMEFLQKNMIPIVYTMVGKHKRWLK